MSLDFVLDLTEETDLEDLERGNNVPDGWYLCRLEDVFLDERNQSVTKFKFVVIEEGQFKGRVIFDQIQDPEAAKSDNGADMARRRIRLLVKRFGLVTESDLGSQVCGSWTAAIGGDYLVHVTTREYEKKDANGKPTGERGTATGPAFDGIFPLDIGKDKFPKKDLPDLLNRYGELLTGPDKTPRKDAPSNAAGVLAAAAATNKPAPAPAPPAKKGRVTPDML